MHEALAQARQGRGTTVLVSGDAGIGKTSLLRAFAEAVGHARVFQGACEDLLTPRTFGPFRDMLRDAGHPSGGLGGGLDRDAYLEAFLAEMSFSQRPAVVMVDDAQWADDASIDVIRYLGRRIERLPAMLVVAYRTGELGQRHPLRRVLGVLTGPTTLRLDLPGLSNTAVSQLADAVGAEAGPLIAAVGGNPFYLSEVLAAGGSGVPATVRDAVLARVRALPEEAVGALQLVSVIPHHADEALVTALLGSAIAIGPAESIGIVNVSAGRIQFRHELARRAVEESLTGAVRGDLNRRVLAWLVAAEAEPSRLVHHATVAGDARAAARFAPIAAREASAAEAHRETVSFSRLALAHEDLLETQAIAELHGLAAQALYALNRFGEAQRHATLAVAKLAPDAPPLTVGQALLVSSRMNTMVGAPAMARAEIERAFSILEPLGSSPALAHAYGMMGNLEAIEANNEAAAQWCARALAEATPLGSRDVAALARIYLGMAKVGCSDLSGFEDLKIAIDLARQLDHGDYLCRAALNVAVAMIWLGRHLEAIPYLDIAENAAREHGLDYLHFHVTAQRSHVDLYLGNWDRAELRLRGQVGTDRDPAAVMVLPLALLGRLSARSGDSSAAEMVGRSWTIARHSQQVHRMAIAGGAVIEEAWLRGDHEALRAAAERVRSVAVRANLTYAHGEALRYLHRVGIAVEPFDGCPPAFAAGIAGDVEAAAAAWEAAGNPYEQALELTESADPELAVDGLRRLDRLGASGTSEVIRRQLRVRGIARIPRGPRVATRANPAGLTARQFDVLAMLGDGMTSAEIADRLHLSRRTVDNHVAGILSRLGVATRRRATTLATERGWLPVAAKPE